MTVDQQDGPSRLSASQEDYLEAIAALVAERGCARASDVADRLGVRRASVTGALRGLRDSGMINYAPYEVATLTEQGRMTARDIAGCHEILRRFFRDVLGVDETEAGEAACRVEHAVSPAVMQKLLEFLKFIEVCPRAGQSWVDGFHYYTRNHDFRERCAACLRRALRDHAKTRPPERAVE